MASWHSVAGNHRAGFAETLAFLNEFGTIRTNRAFGGFVPIQNSAFDLTMATGASKFNSLILG
jgi:hypothetical protein